jgi:protein O-mannosyl-transferase
MTTKATKNQHSKCSTSVRSIILLATHVLCCVVYIIPITTHPFPGGAVLDETHIVSPDNQDVVGTAPLQNVFVNDYWGRPMNSESSHKSWRPLSVLSFRWLKGGSLMDALSSHRLLNIIANAATSEFVSILAVQIFPSLPELPLRVICKLLFAFHPTHVEVTVNAANRPHLLAVLCATAMSSPQLDILWVMLLQVTGLLSSETFVFQMPAVCCTLMVITWRQQGSHASGEAVAEAILPLVPRVVVLFVSSVAYLVVRVILDWVSIPEGLIRPAENPFFLLEGWHRVRNYSYILSIHAFKSFQFDFVGLSQEYGFECIRELHQWADPRFGVPIVVVLLLLQSGKKCWDQGLEFVLFFLMHLSWLVTLFPISGLVKVGTFVSDRIVVASTVPYSIFLAAYLCQSVMSTQNKQLRRVKIVPIILLFVVMWYRAHHRSLAWMDSFELLSASLKSCPRSAKNHLEISKVYSGNSRGKYDLKKALYHLETAESIDPRYCDIHQQMAHVYIQMQETDKFERRLAKAILCPFSMAGSMEMWRRYWQVASASDPDAQMRRNELQSKIQKAVERQTILQEKYNVPQWMGATLEASEDQLYISRVLGL